jgi:N,N-dimethylformamidase beta subunit-like protein/concanavalin A-like lectin/glucanase superfamily protein
MLTGYSDRLSVAPGERLEFKVHSEADFDLDIVRLIQGDDTDAGPGYVELDVAAACNGRYPARTQRTRPGSYVRVADGATARPTAGVTFVAWVWPTGAEQWTRQGVVTRFAADGSGYGLEIVDGRAAFTVRTQDGAALTVHAEQPLVKEWWQLVAGGYDAASGRLFVCQVPHDATRRLSPVVPVTARHAPAALDREPAAPVLIAAATTGEGADGEPVGAFFNGRIAAPRWFGRALDTAEVERVATDGELGTLSGALLGAWDLSPARPSTLVLDRSGHGRHGTAVNNPARAVRGHRWDGSALTPADAPEHYDCMHFHDDDLADAGWDTNAVFEVPRDLPSGVYAARLRTVEEPDREQDHEQDYLPFVVRPGVAATARALFVLPTLTYIAYANERFHDQPFVDWSQFADRPLRLDPVDLKIKRHPEFGPSLYDVHSDGSYTMYSSRLRPMLNFRPKVVAYWSGAGRHFCADLYMLGWLHREDIAVDVVTDEDVHRDGIDLLADYDVVITGNHPEYTTEQMVDALTGYTAAGGRIMYLGGNGFVWVTTIDQDAPHIIEVRKTTGVNVTPGLAPLPGEEHHSQTGTRGGYWKARGRGAEGWLGVGPAAQGFARAQPYQRTAASYEPRVSWIFDGVAGKEVGATGLGLGGAAGDEMDCVSELLGTPIGTVVLASSHHHGPPYRATQDVAGLAASRCRADMTYLALPRGGAVFAVGSMCWYPSLAYNDYDNDVARVTRNVLTRFLRRRPATEPDSGE